MNSEQKRGASPYVSFVFVARNDNYGGDFLRRLKVFLNSVLLQCYRLQLDSELVIVEWNPPVERLDLKDAIDWSQFSASQTQVRIIQVPPAIHTSLPNSANLPLLEYLGKNVGVRRAQGEFILATNPDVIFSSELVRFLSERKLRPDRYYRVDRYDVRSPVPLEVSVEERMSYCSANVIRRLGRLGIYGEGDLLKTDPRRWKSWASYLKYRLTRFPHDYQHINASGDFFLAHRDSWTKLRGYPQFEAEGKSHGIDGLIVHNAQWIGLRQVILSEPIRLYHQDHGRPEAGKPFSPSVRELYMRIKEEKAACIVNDHNWGLAGQDLPEIYPILGTPS